MGDAAMDARVLGSSSFTLTKPVSTGLCTQSASVSQSSDYQSSLGTHAGDGGLPRGGGAARSADVCQEILQGDITVRVVDLNLKREAVRRYREGKA